MKSGEETICFELPSSSLPFSPLLSLFPSLTHLSRYFLCFSLSLLSCAGREESLALCQIFSVEKKYI